ncbi:MAG TPA: fused MFS/spermidine synthase [Polyangiaceae bacterium]|nr:fused MFS/spermidine synthase [Polyangiaceae bacterium]
MRAQRQALLLSFCSGLAVMTAELSASRLVAPYFGTSTPVWAILIGVLLAALAVGAELGGRAADAWLTARPLRRWLCASAAWLAALPFVGRALLPAASGSALSGGAPGLAGLVAFAALLAPPAAVLGAVGPVLARTELASVANAGAWVGRLSAASTAGSLVGTFGTAFVLLPALGTARSLALGALCLGAVAASSWPERLAAALLPALAFAFAPSALPRRAGATRVVESEYALLQVIGRPDGSRALVFDEGFATQSVYRPPGPPVVDEVFSHYLLAPAMRAGGAAGRPPSVLLLGLGAGTAARGLLEGFPGARVVGVELDPAVLAIARLDFGLPPEVEAHVGDARAFLRGSRESFDVIISDVFRFPYVPFHLATEEFFAELKGHLVPGGVACVNVGRWGDDRAVVGAVGGTLAGVFEEVAAADAHNRSNTLFYAGPRGLAERLDRASGGLAPHLAPFAARVAGELRPTPPGPPLRDDRAPVESMTDAVVARSFARGALR